MATPSDDWYAMACELIRKYRDRDVICQRFDDLLDVWFPSQDYPTWSDVEESIAKILWRNRE
jgi:hypothetical protein